MNHSPIIRACLVAVLFLGACASSTPRVDQGTRAPQPVASFVAERQPWSYQGRDGWRFFTPSVDLRTTVRSPLLRMRMPDFLELAQAHRLNAITPLRAGPEPLETFVLGSRAEWESFTRALLRDRAAPYLRIERGGYAAAGRGIFYDLGPRDTFQVAAHEGWHQLVQTTFQDPLPLWLDEGIACYMEGFRWRRDQPDRPVFLPWSNSERFDQLRRAYAAGTLIPLQQLTVTRPQDLLQTDRGGAQALTYYAQCWALVHFLIEGQGGIHRPALEQLLRDAQDARLLSTIEEALGPRDADLLRTRRIGDAALRAYWTEPSALDAEFRSFIERVVSTGGRDLALAGRSPATR